MVLADFIQRRHASEAGYFLKRAIGGDDALDVVVGEEALGAFSGSFVDGVDEENPAFARLGLGCSADDDACFHRRVVEEVRPKAEDGFEDVVFDELEPHFSLLLAEEDAVWEQDSAAAALGFETALDVLPEGVVGPALRRGAIEVTPPGVGGEGVAVPLLDGIGRIGQYDIEAHQAVALNELRFGERVATDNLKVLDAVEEAVHPGDGGGHEIPLLAAEADVAPLLALAAEVGDAGEEHAAGAAGGVVDGFARLRFEHLGHEMDDGAVGVELGGGVAGVVCKFLDEVFVALAQLVFGQIGEGEFERAKVLHEVAQHGIGEAILVGPLRITEDAVELVGVGGLDGAHGDMECLTDVLGRLPHLAPMRLGRDLETMVLRVGGEVRVPAGFLERGLGLLVEDIAQALVKKQREDKLLVVPCIDGPAQERRGAPEVGFELLLGDAGGHISRPSRLRMPMSFSSAAKAASALSRSRVIASSTVSTSCSLFGST